MSVDLASFKDLYIKTAQENIKNLQDSISVLENDLSHKDSIHHAFVSAHTLKSKSLIMGYKDTGEVSRSVENLFRQVEEGSLPLTSEVLRLVKEISEKLRQSVEMIKEANKEKNLKEEITQLQTLILNCGGKIV